MTEVIARRRGGRGQHPKRLDSLQKSESNVTPLMADFEGKSAIHVHGTPLMSPNGFHRQHQVS